MQIKWSPDGGVQLLELTSQEWGWLKRELGRAKQDVTKDAGDAMIQEIRSASPINGQTTPRETDLSRPLL